jgi:hypothetical protein
MTLTSPIFSFRNGIRHETALLLIFSQFYATTVNKAIVSFTRLTLLSFQSFIFPLIYLANPSITSCVGYNSTIYSPIDLKPSTLSCHLVSSILDIDSAENVSFTLASASSLLKPAPISSSYIFGAPGFPLAPPLVASLGAVLAGASFTTAALGLG